MQDVAGQSSTLTVMNSIITANKAGNTDFGGGGIAVNNGDLIVSNCQVMDNQSGGFGGGIVDDNQGTGNLTVTNSLIADNTAVSGGGGICQAASGAGTLTVTGSTVRDNSVTGSLLGGGGILADTTAAINITDTTIQGNLSVATGGGYGEGNSLPASLLFRNDTIINNQAQGSNGGGIATAAHNLMIQGCTISDNAAPGGGGLDLIRLDQNATIQDSTISGNIAQTLGGGIVDSAGMLTVTNSAISNNLVSGLQSFGGGIVLFSSNQTLDLTNVTLRGNSGGVGSVGGALADESTGSSTISLVSCLIIDNRAATNGGAIFKGGGALDVRDSQFTGNSSGLSGGALAIFNNTSFVVSESTFTNNQTSASGGALFTSSSATSSLTNDTFTGNTAIVDGGALDLAAGTVALVNDTINGNTADTNGGGVSLESTGASRFQNTLVAGNIAGQSGPDVITAAAGSLTDNGGNFIGNLGGSSGFGAGTLMGNPLLGPLANNGGPLAGVTSDQQVVQTEALLQGSPAIGKGVAAGAPPIDERGFPRLTPPDIGAFQFQNVPLTVTITPVTPSVLINGTDTFTITVANTGGNAAPADNSTLALTLSTGLATTAPLTFPFAALVHAPGKAVRLLQ